MENKFENLKLPKETMNLLRKAKKQTGIPLSTYATIAINEKYQRELALTNNRKNK